MATLFIASGPHEGRWFPLGRKSTVVGRDEGLLAQVPDAGISRKHLTILWDPQTNLHVAHDMGSTNGVYVNNERITEDTPLANDDLIRLADTLLLYVTDDFQGDDNALRYYRERGQRDVATLKLTNQTAAQQMKKIAQREKEAREGKR